MEEEINAYVEYLFGIKNIKRIKMPKFDVSAYTDSKYVSLMLEIEKEFSNIDDMDLTIQHIKG